MLKSYKGIADFLETVWGYKPSAQSVWRWSKAAIDPLPVNRVTVAFGGRSLVSARSELVEKWAQRKLRK